MFDLVLGAIVAAGLAAYLLYALLHPEKLRTFRARVCAHLPRLTPMTLNGWLQIALAFAPVIATARPLGLYMAAVFEGRATALDRALGSVERQFYALSGIDPKREHDWLTIALLAFNAAGFVLLYTILRLQHVRP